MNRDSHNIIEAYRKSRLLKEGMEDTYPTNWNKGFAYPIRIAGDGTEEPFLKDGKWHIRVYDAEKKQHFLYSYADDTFYPEDPDHREGDYEELFVAFPTNPSSKPDVTNRVPDVRTRTHTEEDAEERESLKLPEEIVTKLPEQLASKLAPGLTEQDIILKAQEMVFKMYFPPYADKVGKIAYKQHWYRPLPQPVFPWWNERFTEKLINAYLKLNEPVTDREHDEKHDMSSLNLPSPGSREDRESLGYY